MATSASIRSLASRLADDLHAAYDPAAVSYLASGQPLRDAFGAFGQEAATAGVSLEDAMSAGVEALQELFERFGGHSSDPATLLAAGLALAAIARAYQTTAASIAAAAAEPSPPTQIDRLSA